MITPLGRDGRHLVTTKQAAYSLGWKPSGFRVWVHRHQIAPADYRPNLSRGQRVALWDLADIAEALDKKHDAA